MELSTHIILSEVASLTSVPWIPTFHRNLSGLWEAQIICMEALCLYTDSVPQVSALSTLHIHIGHTSKDSPDHRNTWIPRNGLQRKPSTTLPHKYSLQDWTMCPHQLHSAPPTLPSSLPSLHTLPQSRSQTHRAPIVDGIQRRGEKQCHREDWACLSGRRGETLTYHRLKKTDYIVH